ncbi:BQ5605_C015g07821 [Microbotryum silenes-dioicae]|uniref:BQ5605_C015g07821 protein n=1 Tax=Microbotryum silenes-dioicae TaxID=796604 RepID=A0A2X0NQN2_9BASI|nr:BQ5605_C015g07821 [Microbotryum silenes-dioicae]
METLYFLSLLHVVYNGAAIVQATVVLLLASSLYLFYTVVVRPRHNLKTIPHPPVTSIFLGNLDRIIAEPPGVPHKEWARQYPGVFKYRGFLGEDRLCLTDPVALSHILVQNGYRYPKPNEVRGDLSRILGKGLLFAEGDDHRRQKRIMNPAFSPSTLRDLLPTFFESSYKLRDRWTALIDTAESDATSFSSSEKADEYAKSHEEGEVMLEVTKWLSRLTLDIIGMAGFGYDFGALSGQKNELGEAFQLMLSGGGAIQKTVPLSQIVIGRILGRLATALPIVNVAKYIPNKRVQAVRKGFETMDSESRKIVEEKKRELEKDGGAAALGGGKDLMTLLLKSNLGEAKANMSDAELQGQMTTFILAGHETTSTALTWLLHHLSLRPDMQSKLRREIREARAHATAEHGRQELNTVDLNGLVYLDAVCREVLRFEPPVSLTIRSASEDDSIPLGTPVKATNGKMISSVEVKKGQVLVVSIAAININPDVFGDDAEEFKPERWLVKEGEQGSITGNTGVYSNMMTFLAGPRACIGYRFSVLELKAIASVLLDSFSFSPREADGMAFKIERRSQIVTRPLIIDEEHLGHRMPLRVRVSDREGEE